MVNNKDTKVSYKGNGQTTVFPFSFPFIKGEYIHVAIYDALTDTTVTLTKDYYVDTVAKTVNYPGYPPGQEPAEALRPPVLPATSTITIYRETDIDQLTDLGEKYPLPQIEAMSDKLTEILQEQQETLGRAVTVPVGDPKTPEERWTDMQDFVHAAADSANNAALSEASAQRAAEAAASSEANAADSAEEAEGWAGVASTNAAKAEQAAVSAQAYSAPPYDNDTEYHAGDMVTYTNGSSYRAIQDTTGNLPTDTTYWTKVTSYVGDDYWILDAAGYIVPNSNPTYSGRWEYDDDGYLVPINNAV